MTDIDVDVLERQVTDFIHDEATVREWNYLRRAQLMDNLSTALRQQQSANAHLLQGLKGAKFIYEQEQKEVARLRAVIEEAAHDKDCGAMDPTDLVVCSCWKRKALENDPPRK